MSEEVNPWLCLGGGDDETVPKALGSAMERDLRYFMDRTKVTKAESDCRGRPSRRERWKKPELSNVDEFLYCVRSPANADGPEKEEAVSKLLKDMRLFIECFRQVGAAGKCTGVLQPFRCALDQDETADEILAAAAVTPKKERRIRSTAPRGHFII
ncbi:hypothetical protein QKG26_gp015 [Chelonid alphaherpesvirus 5]|uniref:Uncharacterized protein n=1 Tax=Chelonid alphaherpesvirus 5 TaxID=702736 RepID=V5NWM9_9ALPH|nr:hypothetical protein QKG26_gp015 [Chelonid alphaherpesvirus 5]AHA93302.1 hypothetical protein [Chelonid alphaherpesvirus 5]